MKNLHVIPTDKPSRLYEFGGELILTNEPAAAFRNQRIYITSYEEIKEGDWVIKVSTLYKGGGSVEKYSFIDKLFEDITFKKIILTTDQSLDGVQAIDDEFLEWFVKNPSCEEVEVELISVNEFGSEITVNGYGFDKFKYKIIIPKEEPKQETHLDIKDNKIELLEEDLECIRMYLDDLKIPENDKDGNKYSIIGRIKWQQERSYTEEEVIELLQKALTHKDNGETGNLITAQGEIRTANFYSWFEQFKKK